MTDMRLFKMRGVVPAAATAASVMLLSMQAFSAPNLEIKKGETVTLVGATRFKAVTIFDGGRLRVRPVENGTGGSLILAAESVTVAKGGVIDASGAGFAGTTMAGGAPSCCLDAAGGAGMLGVGSSPGGGGGSGGPGATGCFNTGMVSGGTGGKAFDIPTNANPGAAGGAAAFDSPPGVPNKGGRGGGSIHIKSAAVQVEGEILADGVDGVAIGTSGTGAGAGGYIKIEAATIGGSGTISARGGNGGIGGLSAGGGGGGGVIILTTTNPLATNATGTVLSIKANGGETNPNVSGCVNGGMAMPILSANENNCVDADEDGEPSKLCGGLDCDDSNPSVRGGDDAGIEVCDGLDNDCNGKEDDALVTDACPSGQTCVAGSCEVGGGGGGEGGGGSGKAPPDYLDYRGTCAVDGTGKTRSGILPVLGSMALAFSAAALRAVRRRRKG